MIALFAMTAALAGEARFGLFVGNDQGAPSDLPLVFATSDAEKMRDLFDQYGGLEHSQLVADGSRAQVRKSLTQLEGKLAAAAARGDETVLIFYYSGHGDDAALHLGTTKLTHTELRSWLDDSGADVRVALLDACQSGSAIRAKGGARGPSFDFAVQVERTKGTAILTSSAASELSQESAEVGGGFFTHYLHSALTGAGDQDRNGEVTLTEAYSYVHGETAFHTRDAPGSQTPSFDFDLVGAGDLSLTRLEAATSNLQFLGDLSGTYSVWDESRKRYVAEVRGESAHQLAVRPGTYFVHRRMPGWVDEARYQVRRGETLSVFEEDFVSVAYDATAARGDLDRQVRQSKVPDLAIRFILGQRSYSDSASQFVPDHAIGGLDFRFLSSSVHWWALDFTFGGGAGELEFPGLKVGVQTSAATGSGTIGFATRPRLFRLGTGARVSTLSLQRSFPDHDETKQTSLAIAPGGVGWAGIHRGRFSADLQINLQWMLTQWDGGKWPVFSEGWLALGYRF